MACGCLRRPARPLQNSVGGNLCNATALDLCAMPSRRHILDRQSHWATAPTQDTSRSLPRSKTTPKTPRTPGDTGFSRSLSCIKHYPLRSLESISHPGFRIAGAKACANRLPIPDHREPIAAESLFCQDPKCRAAALSSPESPPELRSLVQVLPDYGKTALSILVAGGGTNGLTSPPRRATSLTMRELR